MDVAVIGGGIVGVTASAFLAEAGAEVTLAEQTEIGAGEAAPQLFSMVSCDGRHGLGSSFTSEEPDEARSAKALVDRGRRFLRGVGAVRATRACARPVSADGRPLIGRLGEALYVCAGHGPWGISIGPASARLVADLILGAAAAVPPELDAARFGLPRATS